MGAGNGFSGKTGTAFHGTAGATATTKAVEVTKWTFNPSAAVHKYHSNATYGHKFGVPGVVDSNGTIEIKVDGTTGVQLGPGDIVSLKLQTGSSDFIEINHAVISGAPIECDIDEGAIVGMTYNFEASDYKGSGIYANLGDHGNAPAG